MMYRQNRALRPWIWPLALLLALGGCDNSILGGPDVQDLASRAQFSQQISVSALGEMLAEGPTRVEIKLLNGELIAREVEVETPDEISDEEEVASSVTDVQVTDGQGALVLALGGLQIGFDQTTRFRADDDEDLTFDEFVAAVRAQLDAGNQPAIEAKRSPSTEPQAQDDPTFFADELELEGEDDESKIEINVDADNFVVNGNPPPDAWIEVLDLMIELRVEDGTTELEAEDDDIVGDGKIRALVESVDVDNRTVTVAGGALVRLVEGTTVKFDDGLLSLQGVADAVSAGRMVEIKGKAIVEFSEPLIIIAIRVKFKIKGDDDDDDDEDDRLSLSDLQKILAAGPARVEIELTADGLVAREVGVEGSELGDEEEIESRITGIEASGGEGALILAIGGLRIEFDGATRFRADGSDDLSFDEFVARVTSELADGQPLVKAGRVAPSAPQAPDDPTFLAGELRLEDEEDDDDERKLELNIDGDNLILNDTPSPDGWIQVFGMMIELRVSDGVTELEGS